MIYLEKLSFSAKGFCDIVNITDKVESITKKSKVRNGLVTITVPGSTAGITTMEYEPGLVDDLKKLFEKLVPSQADYSHNDTWGDGNGFSHVRAALIGSSRSFPVESGKMALGTWQQIVLIDFDNRPRQRQVVVQIFGE